MGRSCMINVFAFLATTPADFRKVYDPVHSEELCSF